MFEIDFRLSPLTRLSFDGLRRAGPSSGQGSAKKSLNLFEQADYIYLDIAPTRRSCLI